MMHETAYAQGTYEVTCISPDGRIKWQAECPNLVTVGGANLMLDCAFSNAVPGTSYSGLITATNFSSISVRDSLLSKGWTESTCYGTVRPQVLWQSANSGKKVWSVPLSFNVISADTITGCFLAYGLASQVVGNTSGTLWSATQFVNGNQVVQIGDRISVQYSTSLVRATDPTPFFAFVPEFGRASEAISSLFGMLSVVERELASHTELVVTSYHVPFREAGTGLDSATGLANYANAYNESLRSEADAIVNMNYGAAITESGSSAATQDASLTTVHETSTASTSQAAGMNYARLLTEGSAAQTRGLQIAAMNYKVAIGESGAAADTTNAGALQHVAILEVSVFGATAIQDATFGNYLLSETGDFLVDDTGVNRLLSG